MTSYRRNFIPGGSFFFTVNLADRKLALLTAHIEVLREAFRKTRQRHPFTVDAIVILPDHMRFGRCLKVMQISQRVGGSSNQRFHATFPSMSRYRKAARQSENAVSGNVATGSTPFAMKMISRGTWIISISTLSSTGWSIGCANGRRRHSSDM